MIHGLLALIGGVTLCLACTDGPDDPPQSGVGDWGLVEDLRLDANVEDFSVVSWVYVGPQGEIVVPERQDYRVRVYDSTGTLTATIGRRGEGPGEFQAPAPVFWAADTLVVFDMGEGAMFGTAYLNPPAAVTLGLDGTIWVELRRTDRGTPVHVLSETGDPVGSLLLPPRTRIRQASMTHLWVTEYDPLDLASVVRYRVIRHPGTGSQGE